MASVAAATAMPMRLCGMARLLDRLLNVLGYREVDVLGISWGGALAQEFAFRYPERVRRLVLVATSSGRTSLPGRLEVVPRGGHLFLLTHAKTVAPHVAAFLAAA